MKNKKTEAKPLPCPFCASGTFFEWTEDTAWEGYEGFGWIECAHCGAQGPVSDSEEDAIYAWNKRTDFESGRRAGLEEARAAVVKTASQQHAFEYLSALLEEPKP